MVSAEWTRVIAIDYNERDGSGLDRSVTGFGPQLVSWENRVPDRSQRPEDPMTTACREWLIKHISHLPISIHSIEVSAGIPGNALGKFLRAERGSRHGLTPLMVRRLAPVIGVSELDLMARAGHISRPPGYTSTDEAILRDWKMYPDDKLLLKQLYERLIRDAQPVPEPYPFRG